MGGTTLELKTIRETGERYRRGSLRCLTAQGELFMPRFLWLHLFLGCTEHICHRAASSHKNGQCQAGPEHPQGQHYQLPAASAEAAGEGVRATLQLCCLTEHGHKASLQG